MKNVIGIGCDIVQCERIFKAWEKKGFAAKYYTPEEIAMIGERKSRAATNYAAKEAVSKVFGTGFVKCMPVDIEILRDEKGAPFVVLHGEAKKTAEALGIGEIFISLSDEGNYAQAFAVGVSK